MCRRQKPPPAWLCATFAADYWPGYGEWPRLPNCRRSEGNRVTHFGLDSNPTSTVRSMSWVLVQEEEKHIAATTTGRRIDPGFRQKSLRGLSCAFEPIPGRFISRPGSAIRPRWRSNRRSRWSARRRKKPGSRAAGRRPTSSAREKCQPAARS